MRTGISITLKPADRRRLKALARDRNTPHKHVWRAEIVLLSADGVGTNEIMRRIGKSKTCVWRNSRVCLIRMAPAVPTLDTDVATGPVIDGRDRSDRSFGVCPSREIGRQRGCCDQPQEGRYAHNHLVHETPPNMLRSIAVRPAIKL